MSAASPSLPSWFRPVADGLEVDVLVQPRASRSEIASVHDGRLKVQLAAPPVDGAANDALLTLLAKRTGVARRDIAMLRGETSRRKTVLIRVSSAASAVSALTPEPR